MKKILSLLLSIVMLLSITAGIDLSAYAAGWSSYAESINLDTIYSEEKSASDYNLVEPYTGLTYATYYYDAFKFNVPFKGNVTLNIETENKLYLSSVEYYIYKSSDLDNYISEFELDYSYSSARGLYYAAKSVNLSSGTYYLCVKYWDYDYDGYTYNFNLSYKPSISTPSSLKVSTRKTTSLNLSWSKVSGVSGYQLQQYKSNKWTTVKNTTANTYTVSKLKAGTKYNFRVRAYKKVNGKYYYSGWTTLTTPTKPATVTISSAKSSKSKSITVKWKSVTCSGYQVQYSTSSKFTSKTTKTAAVKGTAKSKTLSKLKGKKKYYVRVRAYKTVNGKKYYGAWSKAKAVTTKK